MKKFLLILLTFVAFGMVSQAHAFIVGDEFFLGAIDDGIPSSERFEAGYINNLITLAAEEGPFLIGTETYDRRYSNLAGPFPMATATGAVKQDNDSTTFDALGFQYILAKYDAEKAGSLVWYLADGFNGPVTLPSTFNGQGLSHTTGLNPVPVPATMLLLGSGLISIIVVRRKKYNKK